jgi:hypothetical protein
LHNFVRERDGDSDLDYIEVTRQLNEDGGSAAVRGEGRHNNRFNQGASKLRSEFTKYFVAITFCNIYSEGRAHNHE